MPNIKTTLEPGEIVFVTDAELAGLLAARLVYEIVGGDPIPGSQFPADQLAELVEREAAERIVQSATFAARRDTVRKIASALETGSADLRIGLAGDSTGDHSTEWFYLFGALLGVKFPALKVLYQDWNDVTLVNDLSTIQAGTGPTYSYKVNRRDTFARVTADVVGTVTEIGATAWTAGGGDAATDWTADGVSAIASADTLRAPILNSTGQAGSSRTRFTYKAVSAEAVTTDFFIRRVSLSASLFVSLVRNGSGSATVYLRKRVASVTTDLGTIALAAIPGDGVYDINAQIIVETDASATLRVTINGTVLNATLNAADWAAVNAGFNQGLHASSGTPTGDRWTLFEFGLLQTVFPQQTLTLYNGSMSGSTLDYQIDKVAAQFPVALDALFVSSSHNYTTEAAASYLVKVRAYMDAVLAVMPGVLFLLSSQNPEYAPRAGDYIGGHALRCQALRDYAESNGYGYVPVIERWAAQTLPGQMTLADGLHPTTGAASGSSFWAGVAYAVFSAYFLSVV